MAKKKQYTEGELITILNLNRIKESETPKMQEWLDVSKLMLDDYEQHTFDDAIKRADKDIDGWNESDRRCGRPQNEPRRRRSAAAVRFLSHILPLGHLVDNGRFMTYYEKKISGIVDGIALSVKTDFMVAKGVMSFHQNPHFHFHQYKPQINPTGEPMAQLITAMLIARSGEPPVNQQKRKADLRGRNHWSKLEICDYARPRLLYFSQF